MPKNERLHYLRMMGLEGAADMQAEDSKENKARDDPAASPAPTQEPKVSTDAPAMDMDMDMPTVDNPAVATSTAGGASNTAPDNPTDAASPR